MLNIGATWRRSRYLDWVKLVKDETTETCQKFTFVNFESIFPRDKFVKA